MTELELMWLASNVYNSSGINSLPKPNGWTEIAYSPDYNFSGFSAGAYKNGNQIVISYTGTNDKVDWLYGNSAATGLLPSQQVYEAMRFFLDIKAANPGATFSFTGHSLGGGLASLMAVFFDKPATVFDEAPFQLTALNPIILSALELSLLAGGYTDLEFATYNLSLGALFPSRESNVNHIYLEGEILAPVRFAFPTISASDTTISMGDSNLSALNRHSMVLLTAMQANEDFATLIRELPNFGTFLIDSNWFGNDSRSSAPDLLRTLLNGQYLICM